jgi:preprotein translocase subunit SecD
VGSVRGFAFTLGLTTVIDIVVAFYFTRPVVGLLSRGKLLNSGSKWSGVDTSRIAANSNAEVEA